MKQVKEGWRTRWKRVLSVPALKGPLTNGSDPGCKLHIWPTGHGRIVSTLNRDPMGMDMYSKFYQLRYYRSWI